MSAVLYDYWRSSAAYRVRIALGLLKIPYESRQIDLRADVQTEANNLARNPQGLVPTLEIDGKTLTQSLAIIEYLDETRNAGFLPRDPTARARIRALSYAVAMEIHPICNLKVATFATQVSDGAIDMRGWMHAFIPPGLTAFERMLQTSATGRFCHGDTVTMADLCLVPQLYNAERWDIDVTQWPSISAVNANMSLIDGVCAAHPDNFAPARP